MRLNEGPLGIGKLAVHGLPSKKGTSATI
jgi:hypothetical protein